MPIRDTIKPYVNIIFIIIILSSIYILYKDYKYECENADKFILDYTDFEKNIENYKETDLYNVYMNMSESDKKFINDYIIYTRTKYKTEKPTFRKKLIKIRNQVFFASIASILLAKTSMGFFASLKQNYLQYFIISGTI
jgi:hypothetical protein